MTRTSGALIAALLLPVPATAQTVPDIIATFDTDERPYGETRGWTVSSGFDPATGEVVYCAASMTGDGPEWRIGYALAGQWQVALLYNTDETDNFVDYDGWRRGFPTHSVMDDWTVAWIDMGDLDALRRGNRATFDIGRASIVHALAGTSAAILKVEECVQRQGVAP